VTFSGKNTISAPALGDLWEDDKFSEFEGCGDDLFAERGYAVLVGVADLFDEAVCTETLRKACGLASVELGQLPAECFVLQPADVELAANQGAEEVLVFRVKQVEAGITPAVLLGGLGELVEIVPASLPLRAVRAKRADCKWS